jgi:hypothetical protein
VHFAEQRAAPYSMKSDRHKNYTVNNNVNATHNLLNAMVELDLDAHLVHLGTMGVYGYSTVGAAIPEGYLPVGIDTMAGETVKQDILYPANPGSIYHMTKCLDQLIFQFYAKNDNLRITDLHQGIVWGTHTDQTRRHEQLVNRFDYDGDYGTVLNRFLIQAAIGYPLTVHGTGGQTRAFIHIQDSVRCIEIALENPPERGAQGRDLQPDDGNPPGPRSGQDDLRHDRRRDCLAAEPAQGSRGKRSRCPQREVPRARARADDAEGRPAGRSCRRCEEICLPRRPLARAGRVRLDPRHRQLRSTAIRKARRSSPFHEHLQAPLPSGPELLNKPAAGDPRLCHACHQSPTTPWARWRLPARSGMPVRMPTSSFCTPAVSMQSALAPLSDLDCRLVRTELLDTSDGFNERHARGQAARRCAVYQGTQAGFSFAARQFLQATGSGS